MDRRTFIQSSVATAALTSLPNSTFSAAPHSISKVGVQLYTVRDAMKTDVPGTLAQVAAIGYKEVEMAGTYDLSAKDFSALLKKNGLVSPSFHAPYDTLDKHLPETLENAHEIGQIFMVCPWIDDKMRTADGYKHMAEFFNKVGASTKKAGVQFCYHNHFFEFEPQADMGGKLPYDFLLENTDKDLVKMEMDLGWISVANQDPLAYFAKYPGRFPLVHVKDMKHLPGLPPTQLASYDMKDQMKFLTSVGSGVIDWKHIFAHSEQAGIQHYFVENDYPAEAFADITASYKYLSTLRF